MLMVEYSLVHELVEVLNCGPPQTGDSVPKEVPVVQPSKTIAVPPEQLQSLSIVVPEV